MGQEEVLNVLEEKKKPMSRRVIAEILGDDPCKVSKILNKLLKTKQIKCVEYNRIQAAKMFGMDRPFRRTRFYYVDVFD